MPPAFALARAARAPKRANSGVQSHAHTRTLLHGAQRRAHGMHAVARMRRAIFFALSTAMIMVIQRSWLEKGIILASAVPIALIANITRITVTGILHKTVGRDLADLVFHDLAGWLMIVQALVLLWLELRLLSWVLIERTSRRRKRPAAGGDMPAASSAATPETSPPAAAEAASGT